MLNYDRDAKMLTLFNARYPKLNFNLFYFNRLSETATGKNYKFAQHVFLNIGLSEAVCMTLNR